jgi:transposase
MERGFNLSSNMPERSCAMNSTQSCIAIDVSKGKSHVCAYATKDVMVQKPIEILHDREEFKVLDDLYNRLNTMEGSPPIFIFETTGIYHRPLKRYLKGQQYPQSEVSPLLAAKHRKNSGIRVVKSDKADPKSLVRLFYDVDLPLDQNLNDMYYELLQLDRNYQALTNLMVTCKVHFKEKLDILFPRFEDYFGNVFLTYFLNLLEANPHPTLILHKRSDAIKRRLIEDGLQCGRSPSVVMALKNYCLNCTPGASAESVDTQILKLFIQQIRFYTNERNRIIEQMTGLVEDIPFFKQLKSIPGIGPLLAVRLFAELGDLSRFRNIRQLTAYAGLDPIVYQSGQNDGKHLSISKKGNRYLRSLLYQVICISTSLTIDHSIKIYVQKKKQTHPMKSARIAGCAKLLRIIYSLYRSGELYTI